MAGHAGGKFAAGRNSAGTLEPVKLIFGDHRLHRRQFAHLITQRIRIRSDERPITVSTSGG